LIQRKVPGLSSRRGEEFLLNRTGGVMRLINEQKFHRVSVYLFAVIGR
jgi:hypothetical protein